MKKVKFIIGVAIVVLIAYWIYSINDSVAMGSGKVSWVNDLNQLEETLTKESPSAFRNVSKKEFHKKLQELIKETSKMSDSDIRIKLTEILASLNDNNLGVTYGNEITKKIFSLVTEQVEGKYRVIVVEEQDSEALEGELTKINNKSIKDIEESCKKLIPNIYKSGGIDGTYMNDLEILQYLKVVKGEQATFTVKKLNGETKNFDVKARFRSDGNKLVVAQSKYDTKNLNNSIYKSGDGPIWYEYKEKDKALYCQCNLTFSGIYKILQSFPDAATLEAFKKTDETIDMKAKSVIEDFIEEAKNKSYDKLIIDMRFTYLLNPKAMKYFVERIENIQPANRVAKIYIIAPCSGTTTIIPELQKLKATKKFVFYGEKNLSYQDYNNETVMKLKNFKIGIFYSKEKDFKKLNSQFKPEFLIKVNKEEYYNGFDPIYDAIKNRK